MQQNIEFEPLDGKFRDNVIVFFYALAGSGKWERGLVLPLCGYLPCRPPLHRDVFLKLKAVALPSIL